MASFDDASSTSSVHRDLRQPTATPGTTAWNGATVDFVYRYKVPDPEVTGAAAATGGGTGAAALRCVGAWVYYTAASDHLPLVCDYAVVGGG